MKTTRITFVVMSLGLAATTAWGQACKHHWDVSIGTPGFDLDVASLAVHDDGGGPTLYAGGRFQTADG